MHTHTHFTRSWECTAMMKQVLMPEALQSSLSLFGFSISLCTWMCFAFTSFFLLVGITSYLWFRRGGLFGCFLLFCLMFFYIHKSCLRLLTYTCLTLLETTREFFHRSSPNLVVVNPNYNLFHSRNWLFSRRKSQSPSLYLLLWKKNHAKAICDGTGNM